jgi:hypothetical protein
LLWLDLYNVRLLCVIFDGVFEAKKSATRASRRFNRSRALANAKYTLQKHESYHLDTPHITALELNTISDPSSISPFRDVLIACLRRRNIEVIVASGEADSLVASVCKAHDESAVLGDDSDFFIMGVPVVLLSSLNYVSNATPQLSSDACAEASSSATPSIQSPGTDEEFSFELIRPDSVMKCLDIPPSDLPYLSLLCGNDYSGGQLLIHFARGAGFAGKSNNSQSRIRLTLQWLKTTQNIAPVLQRLFKKNKILHEYESALKSTRSAVSLPVLEEALRSPFDDDESSKIWQWHNAGIIPPFVVGVVMSRKYWNPLVSDGKTVETAFFPLRCAFYRSLFKLLHIGVEDNDVLTMAEVGEDMEVTYELPMDGEVQEFKFGALERIPMIQPINHFISTMGLKEDVAKSFCSTKDDIGIDAAMLLLAMAMIKTLKIFDADDSLQIALFKQFTILKHPKWYQLSHRMPVPLPTYAMTTTSSALVVAYSWIKLLNQMCGDPLGPIPYDSKWFDGFIFALVALGDTILESLVDEKLLQSLRMHWNSIWPSIGIPDLG